MGASKTCPKPGCPTIIPKTARYCPAHAREYEAKRGSSTARGYGAEHERIKRMWQARIDHGETVPCSLCGKPVTGTGWHLDHTPDRTAYRGPAHAGCNTSDGGKRGARVVRER